MLKYQALCIRAICDSSQETAVSPAALTVGPPFSRKLAIQPKANDTDWVIVPNLWGGIIAPSGFMRSR
jgi:hypothetical protein